MRAAFLPFALVAVLASDVRRAVEPPAIDVSTQLTNIHGTTASVRFTWKTERAKRVLIEGSKEFEGFHPAEGSIEVPGGATLAFTAFGPGGITAHVTSAYTVFRAARGEGGLAITGGADLSALFPNPYELPFPSDSSLDAVRRRAIDVAQRLGATLTPITVKKAEEDYAAIREQGIEPSQLCDGADCKLPTDKRVRERAVTFRLWIQRTAADQRSGAKQRYVVRVQPFVQSRLRKVGGEWTGDKTDPAAGTEFAKYLAEAIRRGL